MEINQTNLVFEKTNKIKDDYDFIKEIGVGSFSKVYKARDKKNHLHRCVKKIYKKKLTVEEQKKIIIEVEILKDLDHPNILNVIAFYQNNSYFFIVTEYLKGGELFERIRKKKKFNELKASEWMSQILNAVNYLHAHGIIHRDLKPENIIFDSNKKDANLKLIDFGISTYYDKKKNLKEKIGTVYYIAPEVLKKNYNFKCDVWSCGIILYIFLCGYPPFNGKNDAEICEKIVKGNLKFPESEWKLISEEAKELIIKMLTYNPEKRFNINDCLNHNFFKNRKNNDSNDNIIKNFLNNFKIFESQYKFQKAMTLFSIKIFNMKKEKNKLLKAFKALDENNDGQLSLKEIIQGFKKTKIDIIENDIISIFNQLDVNKTGYLDFTEFVIPVINKKKLFSQKNIIYLFNLIDTDKSGTITHQELRDFFNFKDKENINELDKYIQEMIKEVDINKDGVINYSEFENMLLKKLN